ncbi:hypothetical protein CWB85_07755 [Pseudoalteromonas sp. S1727]|uniref:hypothetical protein n=1 Tax=Pseudoalteromonas mariniglutinosa TaxID=206042 RepID=UPI0002E8BAA4|nr:hypothetical protein [Pseudoalteromonas mariniglutinosa]MCF6144722.1 hypothetical protein [Pseudoalteromonas mariniglutinosa NCIMB 1770]TMN72291.1 hypothetical protein CWB85_07755 [Pseudoalteromonas sp. S1727]
MFAICYSLFLTTIYAQIVCVICCAICGFISWQWYSKSHPEHGVFILDSEQCRFENDTIKINGHISNKSRAYQRSVWLYIEGFTSSHWLIINASGVDKQSFVRLKRATLAARRECGESK